MSIPRLPIRVVKQLLKASPSRKQAAGDAEATSGKRISHFMLFAKDQNMMGGLVTETSAQWDDFISEMMLSARSAPTDLIVLAYTFVPGELDACLLIEAGADPVPFLWNYAEPNIYEAGETEIAQLQSAEGRGAAADIVGRNSAD